MPLSGSGPSCLFLCEGRSHAGMVLVPQQHFGVGETIRRLDRLADAFEPNDMIDRVEYLTDWG